MLAGPPRSSVISNEVRSGGYFARAALAKGAQVSLRCPAFTRPTARIPVFLPAHDILAGLRRLMFPFWRGMIT
jgi:hypothetical protein